MEVVHMTCVVCNMPVIYEPTCQYPGSTKYWSYNEDGSIRPYCSCKCGLIEYEERKDE